MESCASTEASGSQRMPRVAVVDAAAGGTGAPKVAVDVTVLEEGIKVPRSRKMADGFAFVRLCEHTTRISQRSVLPGISRAETHPPMICQPLPLDASDSHPASVIAFPLADVASETACPSTHGVSK